LAAGAVALTAGLPFGGTLIALVGWRSIFLVDLPIGVAGLWLTWRYVTDNGGSRMDSLRSLNAFVQVAEARSFTVAGRQLGASSSAIGKAVARMEERLGVRLFDLRTIKSDMFGTMAQFSRLRESLSRGYANAIVFIVSDAASFITGHVLNVDGGKTAA
jgi:MFS family permease